MNTQTFLKRLDRIQDISTLPVVALKVNKMLQDYDTSVKSLSKTIEKDQAMVTKILRLVNSAFYGFRSEIGNISHAVTILGFNTVRNAVVSISVINTFSGKGASENFDIAAFWKHSVAVAVTSRHLAERTRLVTPDEGFVAGLLHDVGKVVLAQYFKELFSQVWEAMHNNGQSFFEAERELLPANHAQIGAHLAKRWQLPRNLIDAIAYHHAVRKAAANVYLIMTVHIADIIVNHYNFDSKNEPDFSAANPGARQAMGDMLETVSDWFPKVAAEIESATEFFLEQRAASGK